MADDETDIWDLAGEPDLDPVPGLGELSEAPDESDEEEES